VERAPFSIDDCALYPLFSDEVIELMRTLIPVDQHARVAATVVVTAHLPEVEEMRSAAWAVRSEAGASTC
jgi:hypothetical protein